MVVLVVLVVVVVVVAIVIDVSSRSPIIFLAQQSTEVVVLL